MPLNIDVIDDKLKYLSQQAQDELGRVTNLYIDDIIKEAGRLENARNSTLGDPEITAAMIKDAVISHRVLPARRRKGWGYTILQIVSVVSSLWAGSLFSIDSFKSSTAALWSFIIVFTIAAITSILHIVLGRTE